MVWLANKTTKKQLSYISKSSQIAEALSLEAMLYWTLEWCTILVLELL